MHSRISVYTLPLLYLLHIPYLYIHITSYIPIHYIIILYTIHIQKNQILESDQELNLNYSNEIKKLTANLKLLDENLLLQKKEYDKLINERDTIGNLQCGVILLFLYCMI